MSVPVTSISEPEQGPLVVLPPDLYPSVEHLVTEDGAPVDSIYSEKQMRLLTRPLYSSWSGPLGDSRFVALANVGMFFGINVPPLVPDVLLSLGVSMPSDIREKRHRSYFFWEYGKPPNGVIEIVSNDEGGELSSKPAKYAEQGIAVYVVWDPLQILSKVPLQAFELHSGAYQPASGGWFAALSLGLTVWHGTFEQLEADWLRWCDQQGRLIPLGEERAEQEKRRADQETERADEERQRADEERQRADEEKRRADEEKRRAEQTARRIAELEAQLRKHGIEPDGSAS